MRSYRLDGNHVDTPDPGALTAADRCDRCGAQAYMRVTMLAGELLFCAHHGREHGDKINEVAVAVVDETGRLWA